MSKSTRWLIGLALCGGAILLLWLAVFDWAAWVCRAPAADIGKPLAAGPIACAEYWLNRYQALAGAIVAVGAAYVAWIAVQKQIDVGRTQAAIALGDIDPDMWIQHDRAQMYSAGPMISLYIYNNNRRPMQINRIDLISPPRAIMTVNEIDSYNQLVPAAPGAVGREHEMQVRIHGTRPSAPEVSRKTLVLRMAVDGWGPVEGHNPHSEMVRIRLQYTLLGREGTSRAEDVECHATFTD